MISFRTTFISTLKQSTVYYLQEKDDNLPHIGSISQIGSKISNYLIDPEPVINCVCEWDFV